MCKSRIAPMHRFSPSPGASMPTSNGRHSSPSQRIPIPISDSETPKHGDEGEIDSNDPLITPITITDCDVITSIAPMRTSPHASPAQPPQSNLSHNNLPHNPTPTITIPPHHPLPPPSTTITSPSQLHMQESTACNTRGTLSRLAHRTPHANNP